MYLIQRIKQNNVTRVKNERCKKKNIMLLYSLQQYFQNEANWDNLHVIMKFTWIRKENKYVVSKSYTYSWFEKEAWGNPEVACYLYLQDPWWSKLGPNPLTLPSFVTAHKFCLPFCRNKGRTI